MNKQFILVFNGCFLFAVLFFLGCGKKTNKKLAQTYYKLSVLELEENEAGDLAYKKALENINKALEQDKKAEYFALKGTLLFKLHKEEEGNICFVKALDCKPEPKVRAEIFNNQACLLAQLGIENKQENKIKEALKIWGNLETDKDYLTPEVALFNQSKVFMNQNDFNKAKSKLTKAITSSPNYLDAHYYLALAAYQSKDYALAKNETSTVLFLDSDHEGAKQLRSILAKY